VPRQRHSHQRQISESHVQILLLTSRWLLGLEGRGNRLNSFLSVLAKSFPDFWAHQYHTTAHCQDPLREIDLVGLYCGPFLQSSLPQASSASW
jgi:hypothetical protein